jgi:hypothetical protein
MLIAGMPSPTLTEVARLRLESISFFLLVFLLTPFAVKWLWNGLQKDFTWLPKLTYVSALGLVALWGLVFVVVLTMISGARELLTPGAWKPQGWTYALNKPEEPAAPSTTNPGEEKLREQKLALLRAALWQYAESHDKTFPPNRETTGITPAVWETPDASGLRYVYHPGLKPDQTPERPLAYEPGTVGDARYVLFTSGAIKKLPLAELQALLKE